MRTEPWKHLPLINERRKEGQSRSIERDREKKTRRVKSPGSKRKAEFQRGKGVSNGRCCKQVKENAGKENLSRSIPPKGSRSGLCFCCSRVIQFSLLFGKMSGDTHGCNYDKAKEEMTMLRSNEADGRRIRVYVSTSEYTGCYEWGRNILRLPELS